MAQKQCKLCGELKDTTQFSKCSSTKDKLQPRCKECNKKDNLKFRTEINPTHHQKWQWDNAPKYRQYIRKYTKADKVGIIYYITNPIGQVYAGYSNAYLSVRKIWHVSHYKRAKMGKRARLRLLHNSFDKYGLNNHEFKVVKECPGLTRKQLLELEKAYITLNKFQKISLNN